MIGGTAVRAASSSPHDHRPTRAPVLPGTSVLQCAHMSADFVDILKAARGYAGQLTHIERIPARPARYGDLAAPLPEPLAAALAARGVARLYAHQAEAVNAARAGHHIGVVTATASGKTLCYQLPAVEAALADPTSRALWLFPTKALAHDQLRSLEGLLTGIERPPIVTTLDGDTPRPARDRARERAQIILSNPDMLHRTLLPDHRRWQALFAGLRFVVIDEAHTYRGVFGTHVALTLRRLRRICAYYGAAPQIILCSATSANPQEHLAALVGDQVLVINSDGAPQGERAFVFWNPPPTDGPRREGASSAGRRSVNVETAGLMATLASGGIKTLAFARTRRGAELMLRYARETVGGDDSAAARLLAVYRAGYTPEERRRLEREFLEGRLVGLVSTNALELGVDIGGVDAVLIGGFPGTVASAWQQAGRAGRAQGKSLAVLVAQDDPLDQFYMRHPQVFFARSVEHARVALENPYILHDQLLCASAELPLTDADEQWFGPAYLRLRDWMLRRGELTAWDSGAVFLGEGKPAARVNIRSVDGASIELVDAEGGRIIEQVSASRAPFEVHPGATYMHQGDTYLVERLDERRASARRASVDYYTQTREETDVRVIETTRTRVLGPATLSLGKVEVTRRVTGYWRKRHRSGEKLSEHDLNLAPQMFRTVAVWWTVPEPTARATAQACDELVDALHAMEHACIGLLPLFAQCDRADIGGLSTDFHEDTTAPTIFVYDGVPGGVGIAEIGYDQAEGWWQQTAALLRDCGCIEGCPSCIQSPKCGNGNQHLSKFGASTLAALLLSQPAPARPALPVQGSPASGDAGDALHDLRGRLDRARIEPLGPRRAALIAALRYRVRVERERSSDTTHIAALAAIAAEAGRLERSSA